MAQDLLPNRDVVVGAGVEEAARLTIPAASECLFTGLFVVNVVVFVLELMRGDAFVTQWAAVPAQIVSGHHWITILTAMFMHGSWSHIIGNMIFLWAFAPEIEDAMGRGRYLVFYLVGGLVAILAQVAASPIPQSRIWARAGQSPR